MIQEALNILENMNKNDTNVIQLKMLLEQYKKDNTYYMLYYKGKPLKYMVTGNDGADFCNDTTVRLVDWEDDEIWTTKDIRIAAYVKYVQTDWYNSDMNQPCHSYKPEDLEIRDNYGKVYNRKPISIYTMRVIKQKLYGWKEGPYVCFNKDGSKADGKNHYGSIYDQTTILEEAKQRYQLSKKVYDPVACEQIKELGDLYSLRKELVKAKCKLLKENKSIEIVQNNLDKVNKEILASGGR